MRSKLFLLSLLCTLLIAQDWQTAQPGYRFEFPRDHFSHPDYQTEWWYYTGNLRSADGHRYGFELTLFRQGTRLAPKVLEMEKPPWRPDQLYLAHLALSDIDGKTFYHTERLNRAGPGLAGTALRDGRYWNGNWSVRWNALPGVTQELVAVCERFTLRLNLQPAKPAVIQGQNGVSQKGPAKGQASHYVSFTRIRATGDLIQNGSALRVDGLVWMDHEFFTEPPLSDLSGWDWFAVQLNTNEELTLYQLRNKSGARDPYSSGSYVDARGSAHFLSAKEFTLSPAEPWNSPHSGARYPTAWHISVPSLDLDLDATTALRDQELWNSNGTSPSYWEGAVTYRGTLRGKPAEGVGYLEMTGYKEAIKLSGMTGK